MLFRRKGSMLAAVIAVAIAVLVIVINYVTFDGVANAIIRDLIDYRFGHVLVTDRDGNIDRPDSELVGFLENTGMVEGATVRLAASASIAMRPLMRWSRAWMSVVKLSSRSAMNFTGRPISLAMSAVATSSG